MQPTPEQHQNFSDSAVQAQFQILLAMADGLRLILNQADTVRILDAGDLATADLVTHLGTVAARHINGGISQVKQIDGVWDACFGDPFLSNAPAACHKLLETARSHSLSSIKRQQDFRDLETSNRSAYQLIHATLKNYGLAQLMPAKPCILELFYDPAAKQFCAGSYRGAMRIRWTFQPVNHALAAILVSDFILAHEYLSHIVPHNSYLDRSVREGWLVAALDETLYVTPLPEIWRRALWGPYKQDLYDHYLKIWQALPQASASVRYRGPFGLEDQATRLHTRSSTQFWSLTGTLLTQPDDSEGAEDIRWLMNEIALRGDAALNLIASHNPLTLEGLLEVFGG
jgi:hypothetical protein